MGPIWLQNRSPKCFETELGSKLLLRGYKITPRALLAASGGAKKTLDAPEGAPRKFPNRFLPCSKPNPPRGGGGTPFSAPAFWLPFLENRCWRLGAKIEESRVSGATLGAGGRS